MITGTDLIKAYVETLPHLPGVYRMLDASGKALYVGKARDLKNRVSSYTSLRDKNARLATMITQTAGMEFITTRNESEALLLEANLIRRLEPRYNILLRDDKSFPYLLLSAHEFPQIRSYRGNKSEKGEYFGPFPSAGDLRETIQHLQRVLLLRPCKDSFFEKRKRPCLQYQIKRCSAPCVGLIGKEDYAKAVNEAKLLLCGKSQAVQAALLTEMQAASEAMEYEKAAQLRDRLKALARIRQEQGLQVPSIDEADIVALAREGNLACVQVFLYRDGKNLGNLAYFFNLATLPLPSGEVGEADAETGEGENHPHPKSSAPILTSPEGRGDKIGDAEILSAFLPQFYQNHEPPKLILLSHEPLEKELLEEALRTPLAVPQRGDKAEAVAQAAKNAAQALARRRDESLKEAALLEGVAKIFGLKHPPKRIEVYDNSHIGGTHAVGGMIVAGPEGLIKKEYRKFTIKSASGDDDYGMMREVLRRRLGRLKSPVSSLQSPENSAGDWRLVTDDLLLLIDGGAGQLSVALEVLEELQLQIPVAAIAKGADRNAGRERFFIPGKPDFQLPPDDPVLHYLQRLRDEAHRFAIGAHRGKRSSALTRSELDTLPGIGPKRKKALLHHFGSSRAVANAGVADLAKVEGISDKVATQIWNHFHG